MKKIVCCAAVVFGMMEVSQGMEIECKNENEIGGKMESKFESINEDEIAEIFKKATEKKEFCICAPIKQYIIDKENKRIYNEKDKNETLKFEDEEEEICEEFFDEEAEEQ